MTAPTEGKVSPQERGAPSIADVRAFLAEMYAAAKAGRVRAERKAGELEASRPDLPTIASHWRRVMDAYDKLICEIEAKYPDITGAQP